MRTLNTEEEHTLIAATFYGVCTLNEYGLPNIHPQESPTIWRACRNAAMITLLLDAGLRAAELLKLEHNDLYFDNNPVNMLTIPARVAKRHHPRDIPLSPRIRAALARYNREPLLIRDHPIVQPAFPYKPQGHKLSTRQLQRIVNTIGQRALGIELYPHQLRHTFATKMMQLTDIRTVQELLGHKNVSSTQIYTHTNSQDKRDAIAAMSKISIPAPPFTSSM